ncbi:SIMPL domain-containing protein, partial [Patescibacteria group bacterium]|nr:SIMPL domain-containing protein [Patescibacteria group bacterium]
IANAKQKAEDLAKGLGVTLGKITSFIESVSGEPMPIYAREGLGIGGGGGATPEIQTGQNEIQVNVTLSYEIY